MTESGLRCNIWTIKHENAASSNLAPSERINNLYLYNIIFVFFSYYIPVPKAI